MKSVQQWDLETVLRDQDLRSKLTDGVLASVVLSLLWLVAGLADRPIQVRFGLPGLLVYALGLLAVAMFSFQQSLVSDRQESTRAWYGAAGGLLVWSMIEVCADLGLPMIPGAAGLIMLITLSLIVALLWRHYLPTGARFFALTILLNWAELIFMSARGWLSNFSPILDLMYHAVGFLVLMGIVAALVWILFYSQQRSQRIAGALAVWFLGSLALNIFRGSLF